MYGGLPLCFLIKEEKTFVAFIYRFQKMYLNIIFPFMIKGKLRVAELREGIYTRERSHDGVALFEGAKKINEQANKRFGILR